MNFKEWLQLSEAGRGIVNRGGSATPPRGYYQQNRDLPLNRVPAAVGSGIGQGVMDELEKQGATFGSSPRMPERPSEDSVEKGEILDDQGVTYATLPLQVQYTIHNGRRVLDHDINLNKIRTIDRINSNPEADGLYLVFDENQDGDIKKSIEFTKRLMKDTVLSLMSKSGEINKVDATRPHEEPPMLKNESGIHILTMIYRFKSKKAAKI